MSEATPTKQLEVERRYSVQMINIGTVSTRLVEAGFTFGDAVTQLNTYLPKPNAATSPRYRAETSATTGQTKFSDDKKTKVPALEALKIEGVKLEEEECITLAEHTKKVAAAKGAQQLAGNAKERRVYSGEIDDLNVNAYIDVVITTLDGRIFGAVLELECLLSSDDVDLQTDPMPESTIAKVKEVISKLEALAVRILGASATRVTESCRKMSEPPKQKKKKKKKN